MTSSDPRRFLRYLEAERKASMLYRSLAEVSDGERREALLELADIEDEHAAHWVAKLEEYGVAIPPAPAALDPEDAAMVARARAAGMDDVLAHLEEAEGADAGMYDDEPEAPESMSADEREHAETFRRLREHAPATAAIDRGVISADGSVDFGEHWHRVDTSGTVRAAIFGISDGLVSNTALVMGFAGTGTDNGVVLFAGVAGLLAGAFSMAAGEYVSVASQRDLFEREIEMEARELEEKPEEERKELELIYRAKGMDRATAKAAADKIFADPKAALDTLAREELGLNPDELGNPYKVAFSSFIAFAIGAFVVVLPYLLAVIWPSAFGADSVPLIVAIVLSVAAMLVVGGLVGRFSGRGVVKGALRQFTVGALAAAVTFVIGRIIGDLTGLSSTGLG
ncbi:MAG: VIT1/CCC1 transporter family protein [Ilumatobacteraceae bacterium]